MTHNQKVIRVAEQLKNRKSDKPVSLRKKSVSHKVPDPLSQEHLDEKIDVSDLNEILEIDIENKICIAEPGVTFVDLATATLKHGLAPIIVPELKTITIGGAVAGCSVESMSYKHGGFHDTCLEYEVITAKGDVMTVTPEGEHKLIFQMLHGTFGTMGIISRLKFKLVTAKPYVKVTYTKYPNLVEYKKAIWEHYQNKDIDFMDGIIHSPNEMVLSTGNFVDEAPYTHSYDWMRIYYKSTKIRKEDYLKTVDYFFRYDKGVTNVVPKSFLGRLFLGKFVSSSTVLRLVNKYRRYVSPSMIPVTVDTFIPFSKADEFLDWYIKEVNFFPLWCVPYKRVHDYEWVTPEFWDDVKDELWLDWAIYGLKKSDKKDYYRMIEDKLTQIKALKTLISTNHYSEDQFWKIWNKDNFKAVKKITDPDNIFRDLFTKTCRRGQPNK